MKGAGRIPVVGLATGAIGCLILFRKLLGANIEQTVWADGFEANLHYWLFEWGYHALFETADPLSFWHSNAFYPNEYTLAYLESMLGFQLIYGPLRLVGILPLPATYMTLASICIIGCALTDHATKKIGRFNSWERAFIVFGAHFCLPMVVIAHHYQLFGFQIAIPFFLYLYLFLRDWIFSRLITATALFCFAVCLSAYLAPMLVTLSLFLAAYPLFIKAKKLKGRIQCPDKRTILRTTAILALLATVYVVQMRPYQIVSSQFPKRGYGENKTYAADATDIFVGYSAHSLWYAPLAFLTERHKINGQWEHSYFPGHILLIGGAVFLLSFARKGSNEKKRMLYKPERSAGNERPSFTEVDENRKFVLFLATLLAGAFVLSLGPLFSSYDIPLPSWFLDKVVPGLSSVRAPGRFGLFIGLPLAFFTLFAVRMVCRENWFKLVCPLVLAALVVESIPNHQIYADSFKNQETYDQIKEYVEPGTALLDLPVDQGNHMATLTQVMNQMRGSTLHWGRLVVGYGSKRAAEMDNLMELERGMRKNPEALEKLVAFAHQYKIDQILFHWNDYPEKEAKAMQEQVKANAYLNPIIVNTDFSLLRIDRD